MHTIGKKCLVCRKAPESASAVVFLQSWPPGRPGGSPEEPILASLKMHRSLKAIDPKRTKHLRMFRLFVLIRVEGRFRVSSTVLLGAYISSFSLGEPLFSNES